MRYQVPQFIEIEDKIFGPLTFKQFIYLAGGAGICVVLFSFLPRFIAIMLSVVVAAFVGALAFYKINNKPFIGVVESFFKYYIGSKLYIWRKHDRTPEPTSEKNSSNVISFIPKLSDSKLKDLTWSLDVKESLNPITGPEEKNIPLTTRPEKINRE